MNIKILMFSYYFPPYYSGAALQAINLSKKLRDRNIEITFLTIKHNGLLECDEIEGFKVYRAEEGKGKFGEILLWKNVWSLLRHQKIEFDIIHSHAACLRNSYIGPLSKIFAKKSIVKVSLANNDLYGLGKGISGLLHKRFVSIIDKYISISNEITNELKGYGLQSKKICEIPNGVDTQKFCPASPEEKVILRKKYNLPENGLMLLYVGVVDVRKNVKGLIEMWDRFNHNYPGFLVVVGPVSREDKDMRLYNGLKAYGKRLRNRLFFIQYTKRIEDFHKMADIFVLASTNEGMPNAVLEAMSSGLPCIVNKVGGVEDIVNGKNSMLFDVRNPETFLNGLCKLKDKCVRAEMGKRARELIVRDFSLDRVAERYIDLYEDMLLN